MASQHVPHTSNTPHNPSPLSPNRFQGTTSSNNFSGNSPAAPLARQGSSSGRSIGGGSASGGGSIGSHSRDSSHSQGIATHHLQRQHSQQSLHAAMTPASSVATTPSHGASASPSATYHNGRIHGNTYPAPGFQGGKTAGVNQFGPSYTSPSPSRSSFGASSSSGAGHAGDSVGSSGGSGGGHNTSGFMSRPSLRGSLSDGNPTTLSVVAALEQGALNNATMYSNGNGSTSNLSSSLCAPSLSHSTSSSSLHSPVGSMTSPQYGVPPNELFGLQAQHSSSSSATTPPVHGPLSSSDPRTSLLVLNLPYKVRWQDLKDLFRRSAGTVLRADVSLTPDGMSRGYGSVLMRDADDAKRARECFNGFEWMGRRLEVMIERGGGGGWEGASSSSTSLPSQLQHEQQHPALGTPAGQSIASTAHRESLQPMRSSISRGSFGVEEAKSFHPSPSANSHLHENLPADVVSQHRSSFSTPQDSRFVHSPNSGMPNSQSGGLLAPPGANATPQNLSPMANNQSALPPQQVQQLRAASFSSTSSSGSRRPSASQLGMPRGPSPFLGPRQVPTTGNTRGAASPNLPAPPFPPPVPSPSASATLAPGSIPTQHQLAVLSAQAAQAAVAAQQAKVVAQNGGMPQGSYYGRTLFVGNLSYATQWQDLKDLFRAAGNIVRADIALGPEGRSRGFGTALFATKEEAARAVRMFHGYDHNGRALKVHFDRFSRMECPPPGLLVPAKVEDYTSAFTAAQPPSNVGGGGGASGQQRMMGQGGGSVGQSQGPYQYHAALMPGMGVAQGFTPPHQMMHQPVPSQMHGSGFQHGRGPGSQAAGLYGFEQSRPIGAGQHQPYAPSFQQQEQQQRYLHPRQAQETLQQPFEPSPSGDFEPGSRNSSQSANEHSPRASNARGEATKEDVSSSQKATEEPPAARESIIRGTSSGAHPGRITLPSPPRIEQSFNSFGAFPPNGAFASGMGGPQGRAPMPMTPGVPLTPGFAMGGIPPPTPPAFHQPFLSPGLGMMSPGIPGYEGHVGMRMMPATPGAGPPTPWQIQGMSAAPGAPIRPPPGGQMTPRGGMNVGASTFNPFFASAIGYQPGTMPQTPHWNVNPRPTQKGGKRKQDASERQEPTSSAHVTPATSAVLGDGSIAANGQISSALEESALSSRSASPDVAPLSSAAEGGYPFPPVQESDEPHDDIAVKPASASSEQAPPTGKVSASGAAAAPPSALGPAAFSLLTRRASTNSPAVSPGIFGPFGGVAGGGHGAAESNTSFGYFGAALANAIQKNGEAEQHGRERRPSLGPDDLRTPARESLGGGGGYFPPIASSNLNPTEAKESAGRSSASNGSQRGSSAANVPGIGGIAKGHASTEEMARAIAKMSIQGTALKRTGSQRSHSQSQELPRSADGNGNS